MSLLNLVNAQPVPVADGGVASSDPSTWQAVNYAGQYNPFDSAPTKSIAYYDPKSGNLYNSQDPNAGIVANKEALNLYGGVASNEAQNMLQGENGSYIDPNGNTHTEYSLNRDPSKIQQDYQLYKSDPNLYYGELASSLSNTGSDQVHDITGMSNSQYKNLESLKDVNPLAYWNARLQDSAAAAGFQTGHNGQANPAFDARLQADYLAAKNAGLPQQQLDAIIKNVYQQGITSSAQQVAQQDNSNPYFDSIKFIAPLALGAYGLDMALGAGAALSSTAAGSADAYMASAGLTPGTFGGAAFTLPEGLGAAASQITSNPTTKAMVEFANARPDPIQALTELQSMTPAELNTALGPGAGSGLTAKEVLSYVNQARQALGVGNTLAKVLGGGATTGGTSGTTQKALASALKQPVTANNFSQINMNQTPYLQAQQVAPIQATNKKEDFLAELAQLGKPQPTMADILRTKEA